MSSEEDVPETTLISSVSVLSRTCLHDNTTETGG